jgi:hypothetical protein
MQKIKAAWIVVRDKWYVVCAGSRLPPLDCLARHRGGWGAKKPVMVRQKACHGEPQPRP